jgi:hypothetical protein
MSEESTRLPIVVPVLIVLAIAGYLGWQHYQSRQAEPVAVSAEAPADTPAAESPPPAPAEPAIQHPLDPPEAEAGTESKPLPALADADATLITQLNALLGASNVKSFVHPDGIARRFVATVDNLGRAQAPVLMWPIKPTPGRFSTTAPSAGQAETIAPENQRRYAPFVAMATAVDSARAAALYRRLYPLFQQAYEELGYPGRYFNDRLVQVLDQLIATPVPSAPLAVRLVEVKGPMPSVRPWVRYEYVDPALESLSSGQKILLRMGPEQQRRLQAQLSAFRQHVAKR